MKNNLDCRDMSKKKTSKKKESPSGKPSHPLHSADSPFKDIRSIIVLAVSAVVFLAALFYLHSDNILAGSGEMFDPYGKDERVEFESAIVNKIVSEDMELDMQFRRNNVQPNILSNDDQTNLMLKSIPSAFMMSEVAMRAGMVNVAQRAAFEAMEAIPNYNKSSRALCRLVETNLITGQTEVALKYIAILEQTTFYGGWAGKMKQMAENPQLLHNHKFYHRLKEYYENGEDFFFY